MVGPDIAIALKRGTTGRKGSLGESIGRAAAINAALLATAWLSASSWSDEEHARMWRFVAMLGVLPVGCKLSLNHRVGSRSAHWRCAGTCGGATYSDGRRAGAV